MEFGMQFFPDVKPAQRSAAQYFDESLRLVDWCDIYGYSHIRIVEHYFHHWGGYSPNPIVFLTAASQRTRRARLVTGALLPVFNHPLKLAGEIAMLDAISGGRLDVGFARAFLPYEFRHFGVSMDESVARFEEGIEQVRLLLEGEDVSHQGKFHSFEHVTSLPRPTQQPRPAFYIAAVGTPQSFERAGALGYGLMAIPGVGSSPAELVGIYREAWRKAGHPDKPRLMLANFMYCHEDREQAIAIAKPRIERHFNSIADAMAEHAGRQISPDYRNYDKMIEKVRAETFESQIHHHAAFVGTPADVIEQLHEFDRVMGGVDHASLQVNFNDMSYHDAERSVRLFGEKVMPHFALERAR
ncbi:MAG: LLM class flavin-dependent oxidoreductase [Betaproteobacteria bacterium]|nr:LLM class flavin-dependent oxidoreductase [Betaproteobacteria bacterium]